jgi:hypothetical protein
MIEEGRRADGSEPLLTTGSGLLLWKCPSVLSTGVLCLGPLREPSEGCDRSTANSLFATTWDKTQTFETAINNQQIMPYEWHLPARRVLRVCRVEPPGDFGKRWKHEGK